MQGSEGVRVTEDGLLWATDLTMVVTGKSRDDAGKALRRLTNEIFNTDNLTYTHLAENGGQKTTLVSFDHAMELVMVLPGKMAKQFRVDACEILKRFFAGDQSLHDDIDKNALSDAPINVMAREALHSDSDIERVSAGMKRYRDLCEEAFTFQTSVIKQQSGMVQNELQLLGAKKEDRMETALDRQDEIQKELSIAQIKKDLSKDEIQKETRLSAIRLDYSMKKAQIEAGQIPSVLVKTGFSTSKTPMSSLFDKAGGEIRTVLMNKEGKESAQGVAMYSVHDIISSVCSVQNGRASDIWNRNVPSSIKKEITTPSDGIVAGSEFRFRAHPLPVTSVAGAIVLIKSLYSGTAASFRAVHKEIVWLIKVFD